MGAHLLARRIGEMATFHFIKKGDFAATLAIAERLLDDEDDLIHKAVGRMLRELGKRDSEVEEAFLQRPYRYMARTMLRLFDQNFFPENGQIYLHGGK